MVTDADPAIVVLPDGTIRLITPHLAAATEDLPPPPPPPAEYQPCSMEGGTPARGRSDGLRLSPPPTPRAETRCGEPAEADYEDARAHTHWAQTYPRCASLQSPRTPGILTAGDVLRDFPRHYLALSPAAPPPGSPLRRGVSADISPDEHIPLPAWRPLIPGATYQVVPQTLRQAGQGCSSRSLLRTFASCPERFDSATHGDGNGRGVVSVAEKKPVPHALRKGTVSSRSLLRMFASCPERFDSAILGDESSRVAVLVAENKPVSRRALSTTIGTASSAVCPTSSGGFGDGRAESPGNNTYSQSCTRYKLHHGNRPRNWSQGNTISRSVSYSGPHATDVTPISYTTCESPSGLRERGTPVVPAAVGVNNGVGSRATGDAPSPLLLASSSLTYPPSTSASSSSRRLLRKVNLFALCKWFYRSSCSGNDGSGDCCEVRENNVLKWDEGSNALNIPFESAINGYSFSNVISNSKTAHTVSRCSTGSSFDNNTPRSASCSASSTANGDQVGNTRRNMRRNTHPQPDSGIMRSSNLVMEDPFSPMELCFTADACMEDMRRAASMLELALQRNEEHRV